MGSKHEFLTLDNIENVTFNLFAVVAATEFTKGFIAKICEVTDKTNKIKTEFVVFVYSLILSAMRILSDNKVVWDSMSNGFVNMSLIFLNALIISYLSTAGYGKIIDNKEKKDKEKSSSN